MNPEDKQAQAAIAFALFIALAIITIVMLAFAGTIALIVFILEHAT